jgi:RNA polymerase sigma-70 factor (ECF subfamily)
MPDPFHDLRSYLFSLAYRMVGTVSDAEDIVQDAFVRWHQSKAEVESPKAFLSSIVTRLSIDHLRSAHVRRQEYTGPWLPEPSTENVVSSPDARVELAESLSIAFLVLLESLTPDERAVFLLKDVFGFGFTEIAAIVGKNEANCRQLATRARKHIEERRPRFEVDREEHERVAAEFSSACRSGELDRLIAVLAPSVTLVSDGGGKAVAALSPVIGASNTAKFLLGVLRKSPQNFELSPARLNGQPAWIARIGENVVSAIAIQVFEQRVHGVYIVRNPDKLRSLAAST